MMSLPRHNVVLATSVISGFVLLMLIRQHASLNSRSPSVVPARNEGRSVHLEMPAKTPERKEQVHRRLATERSVHSKMRSDMPAKTPERKEQVLEMHRRLVTVTGISDNHFEESKGMLASVIRCLPHNKLILYDIGLSDENRKELKEMFNSIEMRQFPFENYSHLPHVKDPHSYAWKPIIIKEVSLEHDVIMYGDASMRLKSCNLEKPLEHLLDFPFFTTIPLPFRAIEFVHDSMIKYLKYPKRRKDIAHMKSIATGSLLIWAIPIFKEKLIEPWVDCALHQECIAPKGTIRWPCNFTDVHDGHFVGCHRYDQAAFDLILAREFGESIVKRTRNGAVSGAVWGITRVNP